MKTLIVYDGTLHSKTALKYGIEKVKEHGGRAIVLHLFNSSMFVDYGAGPGAEELARAESARYLEEAKRIIADAGEIDALIVSEEGDPEEEILKYARDEGVDIVLSPPRYRSIIKDSPCPVSVIPGTILVPIDYSDLPAAALEKILREAKATKSKVIVLGIVPVHLYSKWERDELEKVRKETSAAVKILKKRLSEQGVEAKDMVLSGYPDEEIVKVAEEHAVSMIIFPSAGDVPSEISKAASMILDEQDRIRRPVFVAPS